MTTLHEEARAVLRQSDFRPSRRLGQNFLVHNNVIESILRLLDLAPEDDVVEIGAGLGFLTRRLVEAARTVWAIEVDPVLVQKLKASPTGAHPALRLMHNDILEVSLDAFLPSHKVKLVGNLPYSISSPVLFRLLDWRTRFSSLVLMVQKEVADRIASAPGSKSYGTLSVTCQIHGRIVEKISVSPEAFFPKPKVRSAILKIELYDEPLIPAPELPLFRGLVRAAFGQRRKTLGNGLSHWLQRSKGEVARFLEDQSIDPRRRGETLTIEEFMRLSRALDRTSLAGATHQDHARAP
ncbi:MAG: 16S rRNA (adenine(1518)-N(6)/adenine(1519)-N(6))-dimethyltransferase RsmA [Candidatus Binatia bacterium]